MELSSTYKRIYIAGSVVLVIVAGFFITKLQLVPKLPGRTQSTPTPKPSVIADRFKYYSASEIQPGFPSQIPIESGAEIIRSYNVTNPDGSMQSTKMFSSTKSVQVNFDFYKDWLSRNGWKVSTGDTKRTDQRTLFGLATSGMFNIIISQGNTGSTVNITFMTPTKSGS